MAQLTEQDIGYQNVAFEDDGRRIVGILTGIDESGEYIVGHPDFNHVWHVPPEAATPTDDPITVRREDE